MPSIGTGKVGSVEEGGKKVSKGEGANVKYVANEGTGGSTKRARHESRSGVDKVKGQ